MNLHGKMVALAAVVLTLPMFSVAQNSQSPQNVTGRQEATRLVSADAALTSTLDAKKARDGYEIRARLIGAAHLSDGTKLPSGTILIGHVVQDQRQPDHSKLALRFDKADLKNGKIIPIQATIIALSQSQFDVGRLDSPWSANTLQIDQIDALPGVDLHSRIGSGNSGVLVSTKRADVKLRDGSQLEFAIGPQAGRLEPVS